MRVATVLTVYGIETSNDKISPVSASSCNSTYRLRYWNTESWKLRIPWVPCGCNSTYRLRYWNFTALSKPNVVLSCNSTYRLRYWNWRFISWACRLRSSLQQYLPFTVLKLNNIPRLLSYFSTLQQYLPFTVLKLFMGSLNNPHCKLQQYLPFTVLKPVAKAKGLKV